LKSIHQQPESVTYARRKPWPVLPGLESYGGPVFRMDLVAGLTAAAVVIPKAMAYASIAGLPIQIGLYTAFVPMIVYAILGTSRTMSVSTTSTIAILAAAELAKVAPQGGPAALITAASTLAMLVGLFLVLAGILRLGFIANFISDPVLTGFKAGIGLVIVIDQIPKLFGFHIDKGPFFQNIISIGTHIGQAHGLTVLIALVALVLVFGMERFWPRIPAPLVVVVLGIAASGLLSLKNSGVAVLGPIPAGLPGPLWPDRSLVGALWPGALGIALMAFVESIAAGRAFMRHGQPHPNANRELFALGLANLAGGLFRSIPAGGGTSQTAVNYTAGARTQVAEIVTATVVLATLLVLAPLIGLMPQAILAAVVVAATVGLLSPREFVAILKVHRIEFGWSLAAVLGVVILGTLQGILVAVAISVLTMFYIANHPPVYAVGRKRGTDIFRPLSPEHPEDETFPGLLMVRTEGGMTFASAPNLREKLWALIHATPPRILVLDCRAIPVFEYSALKMLTDFEEKLHEQGITLWLAALNPRVLDMVKRSGVFEKMGHERMFHNLEQAVEAYCSKKSGPAVHVGPQVAGDQSMNQCDSNRKSNSEEQS
jgi:SulP family sulfate permease